MVDVKAVRPFTTPVTLEDVKAEPAAGRSAPDPPVAPVGHADPEGSLGSDLSDGADRALSTRNLMPCVLNR